jgi:hypothetical protein
MAEIRTCARCGETKPFPREFWSFPPGGHGVWCRECQTTAAPARYQGDSQGARALALAARRARAARLREYTRDHVELGDAQKRRLVREFMQDRPGAGSDAS